MLTEKNFDTGEITINYADSQSDRAPMVLLHGSTRWWRDWESIIPALEPDWHLYALDLRGHGQSDRDGENYRLADYARDVEAFVRRGVDQPLVLVGYSLGALTAITVAAQVPERLRALVLLDPPLYTRESDRTFAGDTATWFNFLKQTLAAAPTYEALLAHVQRTQPDTLPEARETFARVVSRLAPETLDVALRNEMVDFDAYHAALAQIACPTLMIRADPACGGLIPDDAVDFAHARVRDLRVVNIPGSAHHELLEAYAADTLRALQTFLQTL